MFKLILKFQDTVVQEFQFDTTPVRIGRRDDNNVVIDNMAVSGHHAVIERDEPNFFVLVDQDSLNGTFLNEQKVTRERIFHGDVVLVGKHTLDFIDLRPEEDRPARDGEEKEPEPAPSAFRETVMLDTQQQQELLAKQADSRDASSDAPIEKPKKVEFHGSITILSGGTPAIIELEKRLTTLGKADDSDIKVQGLLVGKTAAVINKRPNGYFLAYHEGLKKPEVNGEAVGTQVQLRDGDEIAIGNTRMTFNLQEEIVS
jgi:pSer/pThr/pTyr-binding forkhead associated (FHA) protein